MPYVITIENRAEAGAGPDRRTVNTSRMTIGRGLECSVRLHDMKKHVSRVHAVVDLQGAGHALTVTSLINPVLLNGAKVGPGESAPVKAEDVIEIGDFTIHLHQVHEAAATAGAASARQVAPSPFDFGLSGGGDTVPGDDPFRGLDDLMPPKPKPVPAPDGGLDSFQVSVRRPAGRQSEGLVDGLGGLSALDLGGSDSTDPLAQLLNSSPATGQGTGGPTFNPQPLAAGPASLDQILGRGPARPIGQPLVDLSRQHAGGSSSIDHVQSINVAYNAPHIRAEVRPAPPPPPAPSSAPDPFDGFDPFASMLQPKPARPAAPPPPAYTEPPPAAYAELPPEEPPPPPPAYAPAPPPQALPRSGESASAGLAAFLEGAGLGHLEIPEDEAETFLRESGAILRTSVEGLIGLLLARSELKKEIRAEDRTMVASQDNNPLKLMSDPQEAMGYLFDARQRLAGAFLPPVQAVQDACDDLRVHEMALMAGMRAAFQGALKRFDPHLIERQVDKQSSFTLNKKVKLWEAFVAHHEKLSADAEDDLLKVFGKEFLGTYMVQVKRLRGGR